MIHNLQIDTRVERFLNVHLQSKMEVVVETDCRLYVVESTREVAASNLIAELIQWLKEANKSGAACTLDFYHLLGSMPKYSYSCQVVDKFTKTGTILTPTCCFTVMSVKAKGDTLTLYVEGHFCYALNVRVTAKELEGSVGQIEAFLTRLFFEERCVEIVPTMGRGEELHFTIDGVFYRIPVQTMLLKY